MSNKAKVEYLTEIKKRYCSSSKAEKQTILDEFCKVCGYNRKYAIRLINRNSQLKVKTKKPGRPKKYNHPAVMAFLRQLWISSNLACSKRLKVMIALWLPFYEKPLTEQIKNLLLRISPSTIDRVLHKIKRKHKKLGLSTTKPGSLLKKHIPIKTNQWDESRPGFVEADTVAHCGTSMAGSFAFSLDCVDIATGWTEQRAVWGKGETDVLREVRDIEAALPFPLLGFDSDNGSEFLNHHLFRHFAERKAPVQFTRSRAYHKDDNAHVEQKNWTHIRQWLGYSRMD